MPPSAPPALQGISTLPCLRFWLRERDLTTVALRMPLVPVILLPGWHGYRQLVLLRRKRARRVRGQRARRIVGIVEVQNDLAVLHRTRLQKPSRRIRLALPRGIAENQEEALIRLAADRYQADLLSVYRRTHFSKSLGLRDVAQHIGDPHGFRLVIRHPCGDHAVGRVQRKECRAAIRF